MMLMFLFFFFWMCPGSESKTTLRCIVKNLEYINCTWDEVRGLKENYTFWYEKDPKECPKYLKANNINVGCILPYSEQNLQRFDTLYASVYNGSYNDSMITDFHQALTENVKLDPPYNLTLSYTETELWLYWNTSTMTKETCKQNEVQHKSNSQDWEKVNTDGNFFSRAFPSARNMYKFQVRVRMSTTCGQSVWSEWSNVVSWGSPKNTNDTAPLPPTSVALMVMYTAGAVVLLFTLSCMLLHSERLRVILVPVVPSPRNLKDLIDSYGGNVEKWLSISKELQDGFKPNFIERPCAVREYRLTSQAPVPGTNSISSSPALAQDYQLMHSYSTSNLTLSKETTQAPPPANSRMGV